MRFFLDIAYQGTAFHGWQIQDNAPTVQEAINKALSTLLQKEIQCTGSGRTDTGVHATQQVAHFDTPQLPANDPEKFRYRLNGFLPPSIAIKAIRQVQDEAHARFDAISRAYDYYIHRQKDPFATGRSYYFSRPVEVDKVLEAMHLIKGWKNFQAFSKVHTDVNHFDCDIYAIDWKEWNDGYCFSVRANRFLRGMVRAMVGTLLDLGLGKISVEDLKKILESGNRSAAGRAAPPEGLYLSAVEYPETIFIKT